MLHSNLPQNLDQSLDNMNSSKIKTTTGIRAQLLECSHTPFSCSELFCRFPIDVINNALRVSPTVEEQTAITRPCKSDLIFDASNGRISKRSVEQLT
jgi:hypothetical protein